MRGLSIGACDESGMDTSAWEVRPDYEVHRVKDIPKVVEKIMQDFYQIVDVLKPACRQLSIVEGKSRLRAHFI
jgi:hypothetical protein